MTITVDQWQSVSPLLDEALDLDVDAREAWLGGLGARRPDLAPLVRKLLAAHAANETADVLKSPPQLGRVGVRRDIAQAGDLLGPYRLLSELGTGGMGAVWLAERADGQLKRKVALKLPYAAWGAAFEERLARERDILSALEHPNIARLYDAGVDAQGRPYLALEYVEGRPIDAYCREQNLPLRDRLQLILQVARAVAYAHSRLVVHRDLKPSNILVTRDAQVRLLDFGIAKLMEGDRTQETQLTQLAGRALTLDYASPEQIRGEPIGTASDVYSLAVVLYEVLTGARPYRLKRASAAELESAIAALQAPPLSAAVAERSMQSQLKGDLDAILNKALKKSVAERYPTVDAFVQDIERHLRGEPVQARPDSLAYRAIRFVRRHKLQTAVAAAIVVAVPAGAVAQAAVLAAIAAGAGAALWQARVAARERDAARRETADASAVRDFLAGLFRSSASQRLSALKLRDMNARELLSRGVARIDDLQDAAPKTRAFLLHLFGELHEGLQLYDQAVELHRRSVAAARELDGPDAPATLRAELDLAWALHFVGRQDEAVRMTARARQILQDRAPYSVEYARTLYYDAFFGINHDPARAARTAEAAVRVLEHTGSAGVLLADTLAAWGAALKVCAQPQRGADVLLRAISEYDRLLGPDNSETARALLERAECLRAAGRYEDGLADIRRAVAIFEKYPELRSISLAGARVTLAYFLLGYGDRRGARLQIDTALADRELSSEATTPTPDQIRVMRAGILLAEGSFETGRADLLAVLDRLPQDAHLSRLFLLEGLTKCALGTGDLAAARRWLDEGRAVMEQHGATSVRRFGHASLAAQVAAIDGRRDEALAALARAQAAYDVRAIPTDNLDMTVAYCRVMALLQDWDALRAASAPWIERLIDAPVHSMHKIARGELALFAGEARQAADPAMATRLLGVARQMLSQTQVEASPLLARAGAVSSRAGASMPA
ncbi:MAG: protein kinase domain-containing protein [Gemmatimonadota bacterium]